MLIWWFVSIKFIRSFQKFSFFQYVCLNASPCNFNFIVKTFLFRLQISLWQHYFVFLLFFPQKGIIFFFSFAHFLNKIEKPKCKTSFNNFLKRYIYYTFLMQRIKNLKAFKNIYLQKNKRPHILWRSSYAISPYKQIFKIHSPSLLSVFKEINEKYIF